MVVWLKPCKSRSSPGALPERLPSNGKAFVFSGAANRCAVHPRIPLVNCHVFKSLRKSDTYVFVRERDGIERLPAALRATLEPFAFVMDLELRADTRLARTNVDELRERLRSSGFHLQLPPSEIT